MNRKIWQAEAVKTHLLAVQAGMRAGIAPSLRQRKDARTAAYDNGCKAVLKYLIKRFGISQNGSQPTSKPQTGELRLRTWDQTDIRSILEETWDVVHNADFLLQEQDVLAKTYFQAVQNTIFAVARSFGIKDFVPVKTK